MKTYYDSFDVGKIAKYLEQYKDRLSELYPWEFKLDSLLHSGILSKQETDILKEDVEQLKETDDEKFERDKIVRNIIRLKLLNTNVSKPEEFNKLCWWIIRDWGRIKGGSKSNTIKVVREFLNPKNRFPFKRIASSSKVAAFMHPDKYVIYDSRVAYSLNWIIFSMDAGERFFPIPESQNTKLTAFNMNVLIRLKNISKYNVDPKGTKLISNLDNQVFIPKNQAYVHLIDLLQKVASELFPESTNNLLLTEMLLFSIADREVYKDITSKLNLKID